MEKFRIGNYEIEPQFGTAVGRVVVRRDPNPHRIPLLYVYVHCGSEDGELVLRYKATAVDKEISAKHHDSWEDAIEDAMNRIESQHKERDDEQARKEAAAANHAAGLVKAAQMLQAFMDTKGDSP